MNKKYFSYSMFTFLMTGTLLLTGCNKGSEPVEVEKVEDKASDNTYDQKENTPLEEADDTLLAGEWILNSEESKLTYTASKIVGSSHSGTVKVKAGNMVIKDIGLESGEFLMDMTTINESANNETFLTHVKGEDFFAVDKHPEARFVIQSVEFEESTDEGSRYNVTGDLTIRDKTNEISFDAFYLEGAESLSVKADFEIDRTKWDIKFNSSSFVQNLGDNAINDEIKFKLDLYFEPK